MSERTIINYVKEDNYELRKAITYYAKEDKSELWVREQLRITVNNYKFRLTNYEFS